MAHNQGKEGRRRKGPSAAQRLGTAALTQVMRAWEDLSDPERLAWRVQAKLRRSNGISYFKHINLRRARRGEELARVPPQSKPYDGQPVLKGLHISNQGGWPILTLQFRRKPTARMTVWGSRPCNRWVERPAKCPRLGWLREPKDGATEITAQYFQTHGEYIQKHWTQLAGKRIFIRVRPEVDGGVDSYEEVSALVPEPQQFKTTTDGHR